MGQIVGPASGSRATIEMVYETKYGRLRTGTALGTYGTAIPFKSETIKSSMNELVSATLNPSRGVADSVRGAFDVAGDIAFDLRPEGHHNLIKSVMGDGASGSTNYVKVSKCRGDIGVMSDGYTPAGAAAWTVPVKCNRNIMKEWIDIFGATPGIGVTECDWVHVRRDPVTGYLTAYPEKFSQLDSGALLGTEGDPHYRHIIGMQAGGTALAADVYDNSWIFPRDLAGTKFNTSYLHYLELGPRLINGMNIDVMRDFALFVYTGMKAGTWTMNFNSNEIVNGTIGFVGKAEFSGTRTVTSELTNAATGPINVAVEDARTFNNWFNAGDASKMMVAAEGDIYYGGSEVLDTVFPAPPWGFVNDMHLGAAAADELHYLWAANVVSTATQLNAALLHKLVPGHRYEFAYTVVVPVAHDGALTFELVVGATVTALSDIAGAHTVQFTAPATAATDDVVVRATAVGASMGSYTFGTLSLKDRAISTNLDSDSYMENPFPATIVTMDNSTGAINLGTDMIGAGPWPGPWPTGYGWFIGQPVIPSSTRANDGSVPVNLQALIPDLMPFTYFEAHAEMSSGLENVVSGKSMGLEEIEVMSCNFTVDNAIYTDKYALGSKFRVMAPEQQRNVTGTASFEFDDMRQYRKFFDGVEWSFAIRVISEDPNKGMIDGCTADCPYSVCFFFRRCKYNGDTPNIGDSGLVKYDQPFRALPYVGVADAVTPYYDRAYSELAVFFTNSISSDFWA